MSQIASDRGTNGEGARKAPGIHFVVPLEQASIAEVNGDLHDITERGSIGLENGGNIVDRLFCLPLDGVAHQLSCLRIHRARASHEYKIPCSPSLRISSLGRSTPLTLNYVFSHTMQSSSTNCIAWDARQYTLPESLGRNVLGQALLVEARTSGECMMDRNLMRKKSKGNALPEWATQITALREHLEINQAELARRLECSAMTISRWERGLLQPSAEHFIQLGNMGDKGEAWFFWEKAGIQPAKMVQALGGSARRKNADVRTLELAASAGNTKEKENEKLSPVIGLPLLKGVLGSHGLGGDHRSLRTMPVAEMIGVPVAWCPNPTYTSLLRVKGRSMEPLIRQGDVVAVDSFQSEREQLYGNIVVASSHHQGLTVSRLRRYDTLDVLEGENRESEAIVLSRASGWRIVGKVLWWISGAP